MVKPLTQWQRARCCPSTDSRYGWARTLGDYFDDGEVPLPTDLHGGLDATEATMTRWVIERKKHRREAMEQRAAWHRSKR